MDNLNKKQKFIILTAIGSIIILATFIWSMVINLSQLSNNNVDTESNNSTELETEKVNTEDDKKEETQNNTDNTNSDTDKQDKTNSENKQNLNQELDLDKMLKP